MSLLIDYTYFKVPFNLPETGNTEGLAEVNQYIDNFEREYLFKVLGFDLATAFINDIANARWDALKNGADYTFNGKNGHWVGFADSKTPIVNYVWYRYVGFNAANTVLIGTVTSQTDNNRTVTPRFRLVECWNRMVDLNIDLYRYLRANKSLYPEWRQWQESCCCLTGYAWWWTNWFDPIGYQYGCGIDEVFVKKNSFDL